MGKINEKNNSIEERDKKYENYENIYPTINIL